MNLHEEVGYLREENRQLRAMLKSPDFVVPREWNLSRCEKDALNALYSSPSGPQSKARLLVASKVKPEADEKVIEVRVSSMRRKLKPFGIEIKNIWGEGYYLPKESREIIKAAQI